MQRKTGTEIELDKIVSPFDSIGASSAIDRTASNFLNAVEKVKKEKIAHRNRYVRCWRRKIHTWNSGVRFSGHARRYRHEVAASTFTVQGHEKSQFSDTADR